jgi:flagellar biosynthesis/type III secretory pathway protein FliH
MRTTATVAFISLLAVLATADVARAQFAGPWAQAFQEGYSRGTRAGQEDGRRGQSFNFSDEADWRRADAGYRSQYGPVERYRAEFRRGYEQGYRSGYETYGRGRGGYGSGRSDLPPYGRGRGRGPGDGYGYGYGYGNPRAFDMGYNDGYEAGLDDGRDRRRFDPIAEGRYRSGDRGYEREYGSRESYKIAYREAFKQGYQTGYEDGRRYGTRRWWSPFVR